MTPPDRITIASAPTEDDYHHALRATGVWQVASLPRRGWRSWVPQALWTLVVVVIMSPLFLSGSMPFRPWLVEPMGVLTPILIYPIAVLVMALQMLLTSFRPPAQPSTGIDERYISVKGGYKAMQKQTPAQWIPPLVIALIVFLIVFLRIVYSPLTRGAATAPPAAPPAPVHISTSTLIIVSFGCLSLSSLAWARVQHGRWRTKAMVVQSPALLLPRTWEFSEETFAERGPLLESVIKWEYLQKFLETPRVVLLYANDTSFYLIPRSAFQDELQFAHFMDLLMRKVPRGIRQPQSQVGFPVQLVSQPTPVVGA